MFDQMDPPSLRINMNPRLGMVAVPTWFWVEGYDGALIPLSDTLLLSHQECPRPDHGKPVLDGQGVPIAPPSCHTISDSMTVDVRVWPRQFLWKFGDDHTQQVSCSEIASCPAGTGVAFVDPHSESPIQHAYRWSSLGVNGSADAYTIGLSISFGAQYRFSINSGQTTGWQGLNDRDLTWTANHQVQEAQAVLTRP